MKRFLLLIMVLALLASCATTEVKNIVRSQQPIGKVEALAIKVESGFAPSKEGTKLKKTVADVRQKIASAIVAQIKQINHIP